MFKLERMLSWRYLRSRRSEGFLSVIVLFALMGIMLGVGTLIVVMAVMNGFRTELMDKILGVNGHISVQRDGGMDDYDALRRSLQAIDDVKQVVPLIDGQVIASANGVHRGALVRGVRPSDFANSLAEHVTVGSLEAFANEGQAILGDRLASKLDVTVGDSVTLISPQVTETLFGGIPRSRQFTVAAIFSIGMYQYDSGFVFISLLAAQQFFQSGNRVGALEVSVADALRLDGVLAQVDVLAEREQLRYYDWRERNREFFRALRVERNVMFLILTLIILVAVFNIVSGLILLVKDKHRDIAVLRGMGASKAFLMRVFFGSGALIGFGGTFLGAALGLLFVDNIKGIQHFLESTFATDLFAEEVYFLSSLPARVEPVEVVLVIVMSLVFSFVATLYPAWRAASVDPVEILRYG